MMTDIGEEQQVAMPVMKALPEVNACPMQRVDQGSFHETRFVNRPARTVIRARRPFDHPVKDFELAELLLPWRDAFGPEIIDERMLAGSGPHGEQWSQVFIEEIPFLLEAIQPTGGFFFDSLLEGEEVFVGELLRRHE